MSRFDDSGPFTHHVPPPCHEEVAVIYADEDLLVVEKPAGLLSVPGRFVKDSALQRMLFEYPDARIVHRLDLDTSGILLFALSPMAVSDLNRQFRERTVHKTYHAIVHGDVAEASGEINLALRPDPDNRPRQVVDEVGGKPSQTRFRRLRAGGGSSDLELTPITGRSHQLRLHLAAIDHPILGCDLYAHPEAFRASERLCLHASRIVISHPRTGEVRAFESPVPFLPD